MLTLYSYYRSSAAYRVRIALNYKAVPYEQKHVHLAKGQQFTAEYKSLNPQGLVPTLVDDEKAISQSVAILEYLEEKFPTPALLPKDIYDKAVVRSMLQFIACDIHPLNNLRVLTYLKESFKVADDKKMQWYHHWLKAGFDALEEMVSRHSGKCCFGDVVTMADIALIPQVYNARRFGFDLAAYPKVLAVNDYCLSLPAFDLARPENQADAE